jgi:hypothetical protein
MEHLERAVLAEIDSARRRAETFGIPTHLAALR